MCMHVAVYLCMSLVTIVLPAAADALTEWVGGCAPRVGVWERGLPGLPTYGSLGC